MQFDIEQLHELKKYPDDMPGFIDRLIFECELEKEFEELDRARYASFVGKGGHPFLAASVPMWRIANPEVVDVSPLVAVLKSGGRNCFDLDEKYLTGGSYRSTLPVEFYAHQLIDFDFTDDEQVLEFSTKYGVLCLDAKDAHAHFTPSEYKAMSAREYGIATIEALPRCIAENGVQGAALAFRVHRKRKYYGAFVDAAQTITLPDTFNGESELYPFENVRTSLITAQQRFRALLEMLSDELPANGYEALDFLNHAKGKNGAVLCRYSKSKLQGRFSSNEQGGFVSAICNQFLDTLAIPEEWSYCAWCEHPFKRKQRSEGATIPPRSRKNKRPGTPPIYCCDKCKDNAGNARKKKAREQAKEKSKLR